MSNKMNLPWFVTRAVDGTYTVRDAVGYPLAHGADEEDAAHIVKCVNAHDGLVEALNTAVEVTLDYIEINNLSDADANHWLKEAQAALAKAQGEHK